MRIVNWRKVSYLAVLLFLVPVSAGAWTTEAVDAPKLFSNFYSRAIAVDGSGNPHIAYGQDGLYHAYHDGSTWHYETVDSSGGVGQFASIAIDSSDKVHISYYDEINGDLKYATNVSGNWVVEVADGFLDVGQFSSLALDSSGKVHISYYDHSRYQLKYATNKSGTWASTAVDKTQYVWVGRHTSIAVDSLDYVHISYYDATSGDLKYATNDTGSWILSTVDSTGDVGWHTSIAADMSGKIHISYHDFTGGNLKYATNSGITPGTGNCTDRNWDCEIVDNGGGGSGDTGGYSSIAIEGAILHISYYDFGNGILKYATGIPGSWSMQTVDDTGDVGYFISIDIDSLGKVHISYYESTGVDPDSIIPGNLKYASGNWDSWTAETVDRYGDVGGYTSVATDALGYVYISYYDWLNGDLKFATNASGSWITQIVDNGDTYDVGMYSSIAIDASGKAHISYLDWDNGSLKYATNSGIALGSGNCTNTNWDCETVDNPTGQWLAGADTDIALDSSNNVHISYYEWKSDDGNLKYATGTFGSWSIATVDDTGDTGWFTSIAVDTSDTLHISYYDYDNGDLKYATNSGVTSGTGNCTDTDWDCETVDSTDDVGQGTSIAIDSSGSLHISYYDGTNGDLKYATGTYSSWTTITTLDSTDDVGQDTSIAIEFPSTVHISYYDYTNQELKYVTNKGVTPGTGNCTDTNWDCAIVDSTGDVGMYSSIAIDTADTIHISYYDNSYYDLKHAVDLNLLTVSILAGGGGVTPDCSAGCWYEPGTIVILTAEADPGYYFDHWTGCDSVNGNICTMTMDRAKNVEAIFLELECAAPVKIIGDPADYYSLQDAYDAAVNDDIIQSQDTTLTGNVHFDRTITVTVQGGYNCDYSAVTGVTTIQTVAPEFHMTMDFGSVSIENIELQ